MGIENLNDLERFVQLEEGQTLADLINSEDKVTINLKEGSFYTNEEKETLIGNYKKDFETSGREKLLKKLRDENELSYEGVKDPAKLIEALTSKIKAQTVEEYGEPNKKIESLNGDLNSLRSQLEQKDAAYNDLMNTINKERENLKIDSVISANIPSNTMIPKEDLMLLFKSKHELSLDEAGNLLVLKNGEVLKDELRNPVKVENVLNEFTSSYIQKPSGGSGNAQSQTGGASGTLEAFVKEMSDKGFKSSSEEFNSEMQKRIIAGTLKV